MDYEVGFHRFSSRPDRNKARKALLTVGLSFFTDGFTDGRAKS